MSIFCSYILVFEKKTLLTDERKRVNFEAVMAATKVKPARGKRSISSKTVWGSDTSEPCDQNNQINAYLRVILLFATPCRLRH